MRTAARILGALPLLLAFAVACADPEAAPGQAGTTPLDPGTPGAVDGVGSFSMSLTVGGGIRFDQLAYDVSGNGFHKADTINVAASSEIAVVVGGVPFGTGYTLRLTAQDVAHRLTACSGTATFDLPNATIVPVPVHLSCHEIPTVAAAVPVPRWATLMIGALLVTLGMFGVRRRGRA